MLNITWAWHLVKCNKSAEKRSDFHFIDTNSSYLIRKTKNFAAKCVVTKAQKLCIEIAIKIISKH